MFVIFSAIHQPSLSLPRRLPKLHPLCAYTYPALPHSLPYSRTGSLPRPCRSAAVQRWQLAVQSLLLVSDELQRQVARVLSVAQRMHALKDEICLQVMRMLG